MWIDSVRLRLRASAAALIALCLFAGLNIALYNRRESLATLRDADRFVWREKIAFARSGALANVERLALGDSQTMSALWPDAFVRDRARFYNLGLPAAQPEAQLALLRQLPRATGGEGLALVNIGPYSLFRSHVTRTFESYYRDELLRYDLGRAIVRHRALAGGAGAWLHQGLLHLPAYDLHFTLHPWLAPGERTLVADIPFTELRKNPALLPAGQYSAYLRNVASPLEPARAVMLQNAKLRAQLRAYRGFWTWRNYADPAAEACRSDPAALTGRTPGFDFRARPEALDAWRALLAELKGRGYRIVLFRPPFSPAWERTPGAAEFYRLADAQIAGLAAESGARVAPLAPADLLVPETDFQDLTHLSPCGARRYSAFLARYLDR